MSERVWLDVPFTEKDAAKSAGARWDPEARRWWAPPGRENALAQWAARPPLPDPLPGEDRSFGGGLFVDLVPESCWFTNVRSCVAPADWDRLRRMVYGRAGNRCEACGSGVDRDREVWMEAHERWHYDPVTRTQRLRRLICLCTRCHVTTHIGYANVTGRAEQAIAHLMRVTRWDLESAHQHIRLAYQTWEQRSLVDWSLDLTMLTAAGVAVQPPPDATQRRSVAEDLLRRTRREPRN